MDNAQSSKHHLNCKKLQKAIDIMQKVSFFWKRCVLETQKLQDILRKFHLNS